MTTKKQEGLSREEKMLRGTAWSTLGDFISRLLGAFYIIPWYTWMGETAPQANALFGMGYNIYAYFLLLSSVGLNTAVAKQIARYNAMGQEERSLSLIKQFMKVMLGLGVVSAVVLYAGAPFFAVISGQAAGLVGVLRSLTLAVLFFPIMSIFRGIFQGYNNLKPTAMSQMLEQLIRVIWMIVTTYWIMKMGSGDYIKAVSQSTFAAFVGMVAGMGILLYYFWKEGHWQRMRQSSQSNSFTYQDTKDLLLETFQTSVPLLITGSFVQIFQLVDQASFVNVMTAITQQSREELNVIFAYLSANPNKVIMIIVSIAASIGGVGIALLTESFVQEDKKGTARLILNGFHMLATFIFPVLMGAIIVAQPLYVFFYGPSEALAIGLFVGLLVQSLFQGTYFMLSAMLHAVFESRRAVLYSLYGLLIKLVLQVPLLYLFKSYGPVLATDLGLVVPLILMYRRLQQVTQFNPKRVQTSVWQTGFFTLIMAVPVLLVAIALAKTLPAESRLVAIVHLAACGLVGVLVYGYLALKSRSIDQLLGSRAHTLRQKLRIT